MINAEDIFFLEILPDRIIDFVRGREINADRLLQHNACVTNGEFLVMQVFGNRAIEVGRCREIKDAHAIRPVFGNERAQAIPITFHLEPSRLI